MVEREREVCMDEMLVFLAMTHQFECGCRLFQT